MKVKNNETVKVKTPEYILDSTAISDPLEKGNRSYLFHVSFQTSHKHSPSQCRCVTGGSFLSLLCPGSLPLGEGTEHSLQPGPCSGSLHNSMALGCTAWPP